MLSSVCDDFLGYFQKPVFFVEGRVVENPLEKLGQHPTYFGTLRDPETVDEIATRDRQMPSVERLLRVQDPLR